MVISKDIALQEVEKWLEFKKIGDSKREKQKESIEALIENFSDGVLILKEDMTIVHTLKFPLDGEMPLKTLEYKPRIKTETVQLHLQGIKPADIDGRLSAFAAALTSKPKAIINKLDTEDTAIAQSIAIFFL